jgi:hypothetical protein
VHGHCILGGKEVFLSNRYCQIAGDFWVIRTNDGLQYMPNPYGGIKKDILILESVMSDLNLFDCVLSYIPSHIGENN